MNSSIISNFSFSQNESFPYLSQFKQNQFSVSNPQTPNKSRIRSYKKSIKSGEIPTYLNSIMEELDYYIEYCISINKRPFESDFITAIGQSNLCINSHIINNIINYSLREKGYEIDYDNNCLKKLDKENDLDISEVSMKLVKLMN